MSTHPTDLQRELSEVIQSPQDRAGQVMSAQSL